MSLNIKKITIGFFGVRNSGKSSLINAIANQEVSVVSDTLGTTTDKSRISLKPLIEKSLTIILLGLSYFS